MFDIMCVLFSVKPKTVKSTPYKLISKLHMSLVFVSNNLFLFLLEDIQPMDKVITFGLTYIPCSLCLNSPHIHELITYTLPYCHFSIVPEISDLVLDTLSTMLVLLTRHKILDPLLRALGCHEIMH